jgi:hypothetical protein
MRFVWLTGMVLGCGVEPADVEESDPEALMIGGCHPSDPDYPECAEGDGPTLPPGGCGGHDGCYWWCRQIYQCVGPYWDECDDLSDCLDDCDADYPGC